MSDIDELESKEQTLTTLLVEVVKNQKRNLKIMTRLFVIVVVCFTVVIVSGIVGFFWYESQFEWQETKTITQEVSGDSSAINNVEGNQYNDSAVHNEG